MKLIEVKVHTDEWKEPRQIKVAEDATIAELLNIIEAAGAVISELEEEIVLLVENEEKKFHRGHKLSDCGIKHGHHLHYRHRGVILIVNTREKKWEKPIITFEEVVTLAFGTYSQDPNVIYTVTYSHGPKPKHEGTLVRGQSVKVKNGMVFNVSQTNKS